MSDSVSGAADPERAWSAYSLGWRSYNGTCKGSLLSPMNRLLCSHGPRGLHIAASGPGQRAGPRHSTAPNGVKTLKRGATAGHGWTGSKAETRGGGSGRAGRRPKMYGWRLVTFQCQQTTVTELFSNDSLLSFIRIESNPYSTQVGTRAGRELPQP